MDQRGDGYIREYVELINQMDEYEAKAKARLDGQVYTWTREECSQAELEKLIPRRS